MRAHQIIVPGASYREVCTAIALEGLFQKVRGDFNVDWSRPRFYRIGRSISEGLDRRLSDVKKTLVTTLANRFAALSS